MSAIRRTAGGHASWVMGHADHADHDKVLIFNNVHSTNRTGNGQHTTNRVRLLNERQMSGQLTGANIPTPASTASFFAEPISSFPRPHGYWPGTRTIEGTRAVRVVLLLSKQGCKALTAPLTSVGCWLHVAAPLRVAYTMFTHVLTCSQDRVF